MALFATPEIHAANGPETWQIVKLADRRWGLVTAGWTLAEGVPLETFTLKRDAEAARLDGWAATLWEKERRWFAGETIPGWKPFAEVMAESARTEARMAARMAERAAVPPVTALIEGDIPPLEEPEAPEKMGPAERLDAFDEFAQTLMGDLDRLAFTSGLMRSAWLAEVGPLLAVLAERYSLWTEMAAESFAPEPPYVDPEPWRCSDCGYRGATMASVKADPEYHPGFPQLRPRTEAPMVVR